MKKFSFLFLMALSIATVFTSCGEDDPVTPPVVAPTLVKDYTATLLLPPLAGNTSETFFSTRNGQKYSFSTAASGSNSDSVDFGYFYSSNFGAAFMSPSNYAGSSEWDAILASWKTRNQTTFRTVTNQTDNLAYFQSINRNGQVDTIFNNGGTAAVVGGTGVAGQRIGNLANGQIFVINTASGKKALVYVQNFTPGNGAVGNITIRVKSQG
jgi:hypothetical protein